MSQVYSVQPAPFHTTLPELERLYKACEVISNEAFTIKDINRTIVQKTARLGAVLKDAFRFMTTWDYSKPEQLNPQQVYKLLKETPYTDIIDLGVYKPLGFKGWIYAYVQDIESVQLPVLEGVVTQVLQPAQKRFGYYLSDLQNLTEKRIKEQKSNDYTLDRLQTLINTEGKWTIEGNRTTEANYGDLYQNNNECYQTLLTMNTINTRRWNNANPKHVAKQMDDVVSVSKALLTTMEQNQTLVSRQVIQLLADEITLVARWVEWYSVMTTRILDTTAALKLTEKKLLRVL